MAARRMHCILLNFSLYMSGARHILYVRCDTHNCYSNLLNFSLYIAFSLYLKHTTCCCFLQPCCAHFITYKHMILNGKWLLCNSQEVIGMRVCFEIKYVAPSCWEITKVMCVSKLFFSPFPFPNICMEFANLCGTIWILSQTLKMIPTHSQHPSKHALVQQQWVEKALP